MDGVSSGGVSAKASAGARGRFRLGRCGFGLGGRGRFRLGRCGFGLGGRGGFRLLGGGRLLRGSNRLGLFRLLNRRGFGGFRHHFFLGLGFRFLALGVVRRKVVRCFLFVSEFHKNSSPLHGY